MHDKITLGKIYGAAHCIINKNLYPLGTTRTAESYIMSSSLPIVGFTFLDPLCLIQCPYMNVHDIQIPRTVA